MTSSIPTATARISAAVDRLVPRLVDTVAEAIRIPSVNPKYPGQEYDKLVGAEGDMSQLIADLYREAGADTELVTVEKGRDNACGRIAGTGGGPSLLLNGHVDVVPASREDLWTTAAPFSGQVTDDRIIGRGATDMKGGTVAAAFAAVVLKEAGIRLRGDLVLQAVVGEEVGDHECGTTAAAEAGYRADAAIVCEPTGWGEAAIGFAPTAPGLLWFSLEMQGKTAHAGYRGEAIHPTLRSQGLGVNTIDKFWVVYQALRQLEDEWAVVDRHADFTPGHFNLLPGVIHASPYGIDVPFSLADTLRVEYCVIHNPDRSNEEVIEQIKATVGRACGNDPWLREHPPTFDWKLLWPGYTAPADLPLRPALLQAHLDAVGGVGVGSAPDPHGFFGVCDITWLDAQGIDGLVYGPGLPTTAHCEDEYVPIDHLVTAVKTYANTAINYCGYDLPNT
jgi:acetylornithine deacetylase